MRIAELASTHALGLAVAGLLGMLAALAGRADQVPFHHAPDSATELDNPYRGQPTAVDEGRGLYGAYCAVCHGGSGEGTGNIPALAHGPAQMATDGEVFWFITKGSSDGAMPSWASLPEQQRWQIVTYLKTLTGAPFIAPAPVAAATGSVTAPPPQAPFTDFRYEAPGTTRKITASDLPAPFATSSAGNAPTIVSRPPGAWPRVPDGFRVGLYADGLATPRVIRVAPNGDIFVAE